MKFSKSFSSYLVVLFFITLLLRLVLINYYDSNLGGIEQNVIYGIQRILSGQPLYQSPESGSYAIIQYTPLWYYFIAGIAKLIREDAYQHGLDVQGIYVLCRTAALLCNLLTVLICACTIRAWRLNWSQSFAFASPALLILTSHYYTRGDSLHLLLFTAAVFCYIRFSQRANAAYIILAALFSAACIMTKQSGVLVAGIITLALIFIERRYLQAVIYAVCTIVFSTLLASLFICGDWHSFYQNTVLGLRNGIDARFVYAMFLSRYFLDLVPCYLLGVPMLLLQKDNKAYRFIVLGMACSWLFGAVTGLKVGSSNNYFTEFLLLLLIGIPQVVASAGDRKVGYFLHQSIVLRQVAVATVFVVVTSKTAGLATAVLIDKSFKNNRQEYERERKLYSVFTDSLKIREGEKIFFTEREYLDNIFVKYSVMPTKDVVSQIFAAEPSTFSYSGFVQEMNTGTPKYIVTDERRNDINICNNCLPFTWFDKRKFQMVARVRGYFIYAWSPG